MSVPNPKIPYKQPVACCSAFGRIFFGVDSIVYYSQTVISANDVGRCYQANDPTSEEIPDLLDTDGGVLTIDSCVNIRALHFFQRGVLVFADNGVWYLYSPDGGFKATSFTVAKITEDGIASTRSIVEAEGAVYYFTKTGIVRVSASEFDVLQANSITSTTIRTYFIKSLANKRAQGFYNESEKQVEWWTDESNSFGLVFDVELEAFYPQKLSNSGRKMFRPFRIDNAALYPFAFTSEDGSGIAYNISQQVDETFKDFGIDTTAYMVTGWETLGKFANKKRITQAKVFFKKTETTIEAYDNGQFVYDRPSGCLFQARWDYDNSDIYSKWVGSTAEFGGKGKKVQLYQPNTRGFIPTQYPFTFATGEVVLPKKISVRGSGDAVQFVFEAEPEKDMKLLGYSVMYNMGARM